jgi:hypothetical protein
MAYIGQGIKGGTFSVLDTSGNTYNGSNVTFNLGTQVGSPAQLLVSHDGVIQKPVTDYTIATGGTQITFTTAPASGASIFITEISGAVGAPMNRDINGDELILDADADTSITADTDDQIDIKIAGADDFQFTANTFTAQSGSTIAGQAITATTVVGSGAAQFATAGIGAAKDLGVGLHIKSGDSGSGVSANADELVIEGSGTDIGMSILTPTNGAGRINFSDSGGNDRGQFRYAHDSDAMFVRAGGNDVQKWTASEVCVNEDSDDVDFRVESNGLQHAIFVNGGTNKVGMNDDTPEGDITIQQGADDDSAFTLKSSDVAHGITDKNETDTYFDIRKRSGATGGAQMRGFTELTYQAFHFESYVTGNLPTTKSTNENSGVEWRCFLADGTGAQAANANGNMFSIMDGNSQRFIFDKEGDFHADSSSTTFDTYDDAQLARAFDLSHGRGVVNSKFDKFVAYNHEKLADLELVGREKDGTPNHFINVTGMQRLHNGAIWQQYEKHQQLLEAVYDLAKEAVGEEKANAILDKHEVKRLQ